MTWDVNKVIEAAKALGIKLTNADLDTDECQQWADRVVNAKLLFDRGDMAECQALIDETNRVVANEAAPVPVSRIEVGRSDTWLHHFGSQG